MNFNLYNGKQFKSPIRWGVFIIFCALSIWSIQNIFDQQSALDHAQKDLTQLQSDIQKNKKKEDKAILSSHYDQSHLVFDLLQNIAIYSNQKIKLSKLDFKKTIHQIDIVGDVISLEELAHFKEWLWSLKIAKRIDVISNAYVVGQQYRYNFSIKVML